ncbi:MAG: AraC family transcriptional regulator ligand-binding domain-containing protein [Hyphomicrobiales bacterium]
MLHVNRPTTHFAPVPGKLARRGEVGTPTMISVTALAGVPAMVRHAFGYKVLQHANRAAMLDIELIEDRDCFIPHITMADFLGEVERRTKEQHIGLLIAPHLSFETYGCWGDYVLASETLGAAITRASATIGFHSCGEAIELSIHEGMARFAYFSAARGSLAYPHIASGAAAVMLNLCRSFTSPAWKPWRVDLDIARTGPAARFEETFGCPVTFGAPAIAVWFDVGLLGAARPRASRRRLMTVEDLARARLDPASRGDLVGVISAQIWTQVLAGVVSLDAAAHALDIGRRSCSARFRNMEPISEALETPSVPGGPPSCCAGRMHPSPTSRQNSATRHRRISRAPFARQRGWRPKTTGGD